MNNCSRIGIAALLCMSISSLSCTPPGQRLLTVQIESNGKVVYEGIRGVPDSTPVVEMWDVLGDIPFEYTVNDGRVLDDDDDDKKNSRELEGPIVVRIKHVNHELARASVKRLALRSGDAGVSWSLDGAEVKRIKVAAAE